MRKIVSAAVALFFVVAASLPVLAADPLVTLEGNIVCAKCTLKVEGVDKCQSVLIVENDDAKDTQDWLVRNEVAKEYGDVCAAIKPVTVTGSVEDKDGKKWIAATKIDPREEAASN